MLPEPPKYFSPSLRRTFYEGAAVGMAMGLPKVMAEWMARGMAQALLLLLEQRALAMTDDQRRRISQCRDLLQHAAG